MSFQKKSIFPENKYTLQSLTPTYNKIRAQPLNETSKNNAYFIKSSTIQNSFLKNFKNKHLNSANTHQISSFEENISEAPVKPFKMNDYWETPLDESSSDRNIYKPIEKNEDERQSKLPMSQKTEMSDIHSSKFLKKTKNQIYPLSIVTTENSLNFEKYDKNNAEDKENKKTTEKNEKSGKLKLNIRKKSEICDPDGHMEEEFSASKNILHSSRMNKSLALKQKEDFPESNKEKKIKTLELELANEKSKVAEFQHLNDELGFEIKNLTLELEKMYNSMSEKDNHFNELIAVKEQYRKKLEENIQYTEHLKSVNLKLIDQMNTLLKTKIIGKLC